MGRRSLAVKLGVSQPRRRDNDRPEVTTAPAAPPVPGALGLPAVRVGKPVHPRAARLARTLRTRWWPRFLLSGAARRGRRDAAQRWGEGVGRGCWRGDHFRRRPSVAVDDAR